MAFREIVAPTVKELFIQQLEGMILSGELRPGDRLPTERELADEMKISKTVVHEGLRELHRLGFLDIASRRGVTVADYAQTGSLETLRAIMDFHGGLPDAKTAGSILQLRYYLEGPAMEELAARHTPADMAALQALQRQAEQAAQEGTDALAEALFRYHRGITFLSGNTITPLLFNAFTRVNLEFWKEYIQLTGIDRCLERLAQFTAHIEAGEGQAASSLLRQGLEQFITRCGSFRQLFGVDTPVEGPAAQKHPAVRPGVFTMLTDACRLRNRRRQSRRLGSRRGNCRRSRRR